MLCTKENQIESWNKEIQIKHLDRLSCSQSNFFPCAFHVAKLSTLRLYVHFLLFSQLFALFVSHDHCTEQNEQGSITDSYGKWILSNCEQLITLVSLISGESLCLCFFQAVSYAYICAMGLFQTCTNTLTLAPWILATILMNTLSCGIKF